MLLLHPHVREIRIHAARGKKRPVRDGIAVADAQTEHSPVVLRAHRDPTVELQAHDGFGHESNLHCSSDSFQSFVSLLI